MTNPLMIHEDFSTEMTVDFSMESNDKDLCNDSSLISQLKLLVNQFLICHLICTHKSHVKSCFDSMRFFPVGCQNKSGTVATLTLHLHIRTSAKFTWKL